MNNIAHLIADSLTGLNREMIHPTFSFLHIVKWSLFLHTKTFCRSRWIQVYTNIWYLKYQTTHTYLILGEVLKYQKFTLVFYLNTNISVSVACICSLHHQHTSLSSSKAGPILQHSHFHSSSPLFSVRDPELTSMQCTGQC